MVLFLIIYFSLMILLGIFAWRIHQSWLQISVTLLFFVGLFPLVYQLFSPKIKFSFSDPMTGLGLLEMLIFMGIATSVVCIIGHFCSYINYAEPNDHPNITLREYNHFVQINPKPWESVHNGYNVYNKAVDEILVMSYWECTWFRFTMFIDADMKSRVQSDAVRMKLAKIAQKDIDKLRAANQKQFENSLKRIEKMKAAQSDMMSAYGAHLQTYQDSNIQQYGENMQDMSDQL